MESEMLAHVLFFLLLLFLFVGSKAIANDRENECPETTTPKRLGHAGGVIDSRPWLGSEQKLAMEKAVQDFHHSTTCSKQLVLHFKDSDGYLARIASVGKVLFFPQTGILF